MANSEDRANEETRSDWLGENGGGTDFDLPQKQVGDPAESDQTCEAESPSNGGTVSRVFLESVAFWQAINAEAADQTVTDDWWDGGSLDQKLAAGSVSSVWIGPYKIEQKIGEGGFSRIYAARHRLRPDLVVAIKLFRRLRLNSWQRLQVETLVLSKFDHPNLVSVLDAGELPDGRPYMVMNRIDGVSLDRYLRQQSLDYLQIARLFRDIALAVQHAHDRDVVHRDLKPTNIMVRRDGQPVVIDFGLAKRLDFSELDRSLTASNAVIGTLGYLAPEQAQAKKQEITRAVDVYGLGATLYFALTGQPPLERGDFWQAIADLRTKVPERPGIHCADVPSDLELICLKCLEKSPVDRYASLQQVADDLERFTRGRSVTVRPTSWLTRQLRWCQANALVAGLLAMVLVSVTLGLISTVVLWRQADYRWRQSQVVLTEAEEILKTGVSSAENLLPPTAGALAYRHQQLQQTLAFRQRLNNLLEPARVNHRSLAVLHFLLGKICCRRGMFDEGRQHYLEALERFRTLLALSPNDERLQFDVFHSLLGLDSTHSGLSGIVTRDLTVLEEALAVIEALVREYPSNKSYRDALACNLLLLSGLVRETDPAAARDYAERSYQEALELKRQLPEPCLEWRHVGTAAGALAEICFAAQDWNGTENWLNVAQVAVEDFLQRPELDPGEWMDLSGCFLLRRSLALARDQPDVALAWELRWRELLHKSAEKYPDYFVFKENLNNADLVLAQGLPATRNSP